MGALTLTGLVPTIYEAMDVTSRELVGLIPAVSQDFSGDRAAKDQTITSPVVGAMAAEDLQVGNTAADTPNQTINKVDMTISKVRSVPFGITGEETKGLQTAGTLLSINGQRIAQALRTLTNEVEADLAALYLGASRAYGTAGTTPFGTAGDLADIALSRKILDDNGAPLSDRHMVFDSAAGGNMRSKQSGLFKVSEAGDGGNFLRRGVLGDIYNFGLHESAGIKNAVTAGTAASATTNTAGYAVGATVITLASAGTGTFIIGDVIAFAGDTEKYVLTAGDADVSGGGTITLAEPGLRKAIPASATAITRSAAATRNMFFQRSAIQLATRAPAMPDGGDAADDVEIIVDPVSGLAFEFCVYKQKRQVRYEVNLAWGCKVIAPRHLGILLG